MTEILPARTNPHSSAVNQTLGRPDPYRGVTEVRLHDDPDAPRKQRHTAKRISDRFLAEHDSGGVVSYEMVRDYVAARRLDVSIEAVWDPSNEAAGTLARATTAAIRSSLSGTPYLSVTDSPYRQTVWNHLEGRDPRAGIKDYDLFYFDEADLSYDAEDRLIRNAETLFGDIDEPVEVRNEARVHLWYEDLFGVSAVPFTSCADAIDHFASTTCCFGITRSSEGNRDVYAPHGFDDLFDMVLRPNPVLAPQEIYEAKAARWKAEWPRLTVIPWPDLLVVR